MGFFDKLKSMVAGDDSSDSSSSSSAPKQSALRVTDAQISVREWLTSLSPEWKEALDQNSYSLSLDQDDEELDRSFRELKSLEVSDNAKIKDLTPVAALTFLKKLDIGECRVQDLSPIKNMQLETLDITNNPIKDLSPLAGMTSLKKLRFGGRDFKLIDNIDALSGLVNLEEVRMVESNVSSAKAFANCKALKEFDAADTPLNSFEGLENCTNLERISVHRTHVADLAPLSGMTNLKYLALFHCPNVKDLSIASNWKSMEHLDIAYTGITNLSPLHELTNLEEFESSSWLKEQNAALQLSLPTCKIVEFG
jgi:Leucine-rich repeat (LRR) protein